MKYLPIRAADQKDRSSGNENAKTWEPVLVRMLQWILWILWKCVDQSFVSYWEDGMVRDTYIHFQWLLFRACLHGVGDPGLVGLVSFVFTLWGTQNKRNLPH